MASKLVSSDLVAPRADLDAQLIGVSFDGPAPVSPSWLRMGDLSVLFGANGSGKSTTINHLARHLRDPQAHWKSWGGGSREGDAALHFLKLTDDSLDELLRGLLAARAEAGSAEAPWPLGGWKGNRENSAPDGWEDQAPRDAILGCLGAQAPQPADAAAAVLETLRRSTIVAVEPSETNDVFNLYWCLDEPDADLSQAIEAIGARDDPPIFSAFAWNRPRKHLRLDGAPALAAPLGQIRGEVLPEVFQVPAPWSQVAESLRESVLETIVFYDWANDDWQNGGFDEIDVGQQALRRGRGAWFAETEDRGPVPNPLGVRCCGVLGRTATGLLPDFVSDRHEIEITLPPLQEWGDRGPELRVSLTSPGGGDSFPIEQVAAGHRMWLQLALLEAAAVLRRFRIWLERALDNFFDARDYGLRDDDYVAEDDPAWHEVARGLRCLREVAAGESDTALDQLLTVRDGRARLYLLDEPEQHLHPAQQRVAAQWLSELADRAGSQCVLATHSPYFLRLKNNATFARLALNSASPEPESYTINPMNPVAIEALDGFAREMGFDRGELLTTVSAILFVEGRADYNMLMALYERALHHAGVVVVPIHGSSRAPGIVDSEVVLRWTSARFAVLLDDVPEETWRRMDADPDYRAEMTSSGRGEVQAMACLLQRAAELGREIISVGLDAPDMFDLLDETILKGRFPKFPGHTAARDSERRKPSEHWKQHYDRKYGIHVEPELFAEIGERMAATNSRCPQLEHILERVSGAPIT